jgi:hypothetical protein
MKRSLDQNNYYFGVLVEEVIAFYKANQIELVRDLMKFVEKKTGATFDYNKDFIHEILKLMFNEGNSTVFKDDDKPNQDGEILTGTTKMNAYWDRIREYFLDEHKKDIPLPNEPPIEVLMNERI